MAHGLVAFALLHCISLAVEGKLAISLKQFFSFQQFIVLVRYGI